MSDTDVAMTDDTPAILFRPSKKRRVYRQRGSVSPPSSQSTPLPESLPQNHSQTPLSSDDEAGVIKARNVRKSRPLGVAFKSSSAPTGGPDSLAHAPTADDGVGTDLVLHNVAPSRFTIATGLTTELNSRHMMEYIETGLARRLNRPQPTPPADAPANAPPKQLPTPPTAPAAASTTSSQPAALRGRILEVDLGDEVRSKNAELTARAASRLKSGGAAGDVDDASDSGGKHRRVGRPRRDSDAIERDRLVEEFLHENRLDVYDLNPTTGAVQSSGGNYFDSAELDLFNNPPDDPSGNLGINPSAAAIAADDRIAEQFRREFMEALQERQQLRRRKRKAASNAPPPPRAGGGPSAPPGVAAAPTRLGKKDESEILRGPKLGGSRNDRAQMRDLLLASQKEKRGGMGRRR